LYDCKIGTECEAEDVLATPLGQLPLISYAYEDEVVAKWLASG